MTAALAELAVGDSLPDLVSPKITRHTLALFCGASGDHNPMHVDFDFARAHGMDDVFAQGMLSMAFLAQVLTRSIPQANIRQWGARFLAITPVNVTVRCTARVVEKFEADGEQRLRLALDAHTDQGEHTLSGEAIVAVP